MGLAVAGSGRVRGRSGQSIEGRPGAISLGRPGPGLIDRRTRVSRLGVEAMRVTPLCTRKRRVALLIGSLCFGALLSACSYWRIWGFGDLFLYLRPGPPLPGCSGALARRDP